MAVTNLALLTVDAKNRALRSFVQGLSVDLAVAIVTVLLTVFTDANGWGDLQWAVIGFTLAKTCVQSLAAFIMRRFVDGSAVRTPLPPEPAVEPAEPVLGD